MQNLRVAQIQLFHSCTNSLGYSFKWKTIQSRIFFGLLSVDILYMHQFVNYANIQTNYMDIIYMQYTPLFSSAKSPCHLLQFLKRCNLTAFLPWELLHQHLVDARPLLFLPRKQGFTSNFSLPYTFSFSLWRFQCLNSSFRLRLFHRTERSIAIRQCHRHSFHSERRLPRPSESGCRKSMAAKSIFQITNLPEINYQPPVFINFALTFSL